jgi:Ala-tRNA(Pro) deacylase
MDQITPQPPALPTSPQQLLDYLTSLDIPHETVTHEAVFTVEESQAVTASIPGGHTKNLFVKDKKGRLFLVSAEKHARIDLKRLHEHLGAQGRLSFCSAEQMMTHLGVTPGSVCAFAVYNDKAGAVTMVLDQGLMAHDRINFHPLINTMTTGIARDDLVRFLKATGHDPLILALPEPPTEDLPQG